jgi:hypothetical protein
VKRIVELADATVVEHLHGFDLVVDSFDPSQRLLDVRRGRRLPIGAHLLECTVGRGGAGKDRTLSLWIIFAANDLSEFFLRQVKTVANSPRPSFEPMS